MASSLGNAFGSFGESGAPGFIDPFSMNAAGIGQGASLTAMANRYNQLGVKAPGGGASTMELMDEGAAPSVTGGIPGQFNALLGEIQNSALRNAPSGSGQQNTVSQLGGILGALGRKG